MLLGKKLDLLSTLSHLCGLFLWAILCGALLLPLMLKSPFFPVLQTITGTEDSISKNCFAPIELTGELSCRKTPCGFFLSKNRICVICFNPGHFLLLPVMK